MTIAAGFTCTDGILLCADREESVGASKKVVQKLITLHAVPWNLTVATAGSSPVADLAVQRLKEAFLKLFATTLDLRDLREQHQQLIIDVLTKIHKDHVWNNPDPKRHEFELIIGLNFPEHDRQYLYLTHENVPQPIQNYCCTGYGADLCIYFAERMYRKTLTKDEMILLASCIFREVNSAMQYCGKGTDMVLLRHRKGGIQIHPAGVEDVQNEIPSFAKAMSAFWDTMQLLPQWLTSIENASQQMEEPEKTP